MNTYRCNPDGEENQCAMRVNLCYIGALKLQFLHNQREAEATMPKAGGRSLATDDVRNKAGDCGDSIQ